MTHRAVLSGLLGAAALAASGCAGRAGRTDAARPDTPAATSRVDGAGSAGRVEPGRAWPQRREPLTADEARRAILTYLSESPDAARGAWLRESRPFVERREASVGPGHLSWGPWFVDRWTGRATLAALNEGGGYTLEAVVSTEGRRPELTDVKLYRVRGPVVTRQVEVERSR